VKANQFPLFFDALEVIIMAMIVLARHRSLQIDQILLEAKLDAASPKWKKSIQL